MSATLKTIIYPRDLAQSAPITPANVSYRVQRYSGAVLGGPIACSVQASGEMTPLFELIELLRCPIEIYDWRLGTVWWGYISKVTISTGTVEIGAALDSMYNHIAVAYSYVAAGTSSVGERKTTAYSSDTDSASEYGTKDLLLSLGGATDAQALQTRDTALSIYKYPIAIWQKAATEQATATIECRGWWDTLAWRMLKVTTSNTVETTTQIGNAIAAVGQFFAGSEIETASGSSTNEYRDGDTTAQAEIEELLTAGTSGGARLAALVTPERVARVFAEPASGAADYSLKLSGAILDAYDNPISPAACPVGIWLRTNNIWPATANLTRLANPDIAFIDRAEYDAQRDQYAPLARGVPSAWDIGKQVQR
jgi:hypothetical protein